MVVKDKKFENWLMADLAALKAHKKPYKVSSATTKAIQPNKADSANAAILIRRSTIGPAYDKVEDAKTILESADPLRMAQHSRSSGASCGSPGTLYTRGRAGFRPPRQT